MPNVPTKPDTKKETGPWLLVLFHMQDLI